MLIVGGYTEKIEGNTSAKARGISVYDFFPSEGRIQFLAFTPAINPSFLITDRKRSIIYAVRELQDERAGLTAHRVRRNKKGKVSFELLSDINLTGSGPCHLSFAGNTILAACYNSGHLHVVGRNEDGTLGEVLQTIPLSPSTPGNEPHAHCTAYHAERQRVYLCDLGDDKLKVFDRADDGLLTERPELALSFPKKECVRHIVLHPDGALALANGECVGRVYLIDLSGEKPSRADSINILPERVVNEAWGAAIKLGSNGKMVYTSERNFSVVTVLRLDERDKKLVVRDTYPSGGESPRDLALSLKGEWLLTANTSDHSVGVFRIDPRGGLVHYHTFKKVPSPSCLAWL